MTQIFFGIVSPVVARTSGTIMLLTRPQRGKGLPIRGGAAPLAPSVPERWRVLDDGAAAVAFEGPWPKYCWRPPNGQRRRGAGGQIWEAIEARFPRAKVWAVVATVTAMVPPYGSAPGPASGSRASCTTATPNTSRRANKTAPAPGPRRICSS